MSFPKNKNESPPTHSVQDKKLAASVYLKEVSSRIHDVAKELSTLHGLFTPVQKDLSRDHRSALTSLKRTIIPFLEESSSKMSASALVVSPIA